MNIFGFIFWWLVWVVGGVALETKLKIKSAYTFGVNILAMFCAIMGAILLKIMRT